MYYLYYVRVFALNSKKNKNNKKKSVSENVHQLIQMALWYLCSVLF